MAPFRASRSTRSGRPGGQTEQDVFDGLPVRQWRFQDATVSANEEPGQPQDVAIRGHGLWKELPMPKGSEHYTPWSQQILREARLGRIVISSQNYSRSGFGRAAKDDDKENDMDITIDGIGDDRRAKLSGQGFMAKRWLQTPKHLEEPEVEHLAKRRRGISSTHANSDGVVAPPVVVGTLRKSRVRRVDEQGRTNMWEVLVPEGHVIDGEVDEPGMAENLGISISRPTPGTIIGGLGIANDDGVIVVSTTNVPAVSVVSTPVRPRGPRRKIRGGFRKGRGKKLGYGESGGVSASAEALYASRDAATDTDNPAIGDVDEMDHAANNAAKDGREEEETDGEIDEDEADEEDGEAEPDEDEADGDEDMNRDDDDDDREEGELTPSPEPPDAKELLARFSPSMTTKPPPQTLKPPVLPAHPLPAKPVIPETAQVRKHRPNSPKPVVTIAPTKSRSSSPKPHKRAEPVEQSTSSTFESLPDNPTPLIAVAAPANDEPHATTAPGTDMSFIEPDIEEPADEAIETGLILEELAVRAVDPKPFNEEPNFEANIGQPVIQEMAIAPSEEEPIIEEPDAEKLVNKDLGVSRPAIEEVVIEEQILDKPAVEEPVDELPNTTERTTEETLPEQILPENPTLNHLNTREPITNVLITAESIAEIPLIEETSIEESIIAKPPNEIPAVEVSTTETLIIEEPEAAEAVDEHMTTEEPASAELVDENMGMEESVPETVVTQNTMIGELSIEEANTEDVPTVTSPLSPAAATSPPQGDHPITDPQPQPEPEPMLIDIPSAQNTTITVQGSKTEPATTRSHESKEEETTKEASPESMAVDVREGGDVYFPDGDVDLLGSLERGLEMQSREGAGAGAVEGEDEGEDGM